MSTENNKALVRRFYEEVWNKGNLTAVDELIAPNYVNHFDAPANVSVPERFQQGRQETKQFIPQWLTTFPDLHFIVEFQVAEGDLVVTHGTACGTHQGGV
jgi:predicted SnoaL-like aldol condensation-catalyzing enzyme